MLVINERHDSKAWLNAIGAGDCRLVEGWDPVYEDPLPSDTDYTPQRVKEIDCQIRCSKCGIRIQTMPPPRT